MKKTLGILILYIALACSPAKRYMETAKVWEKDIQNLEQKDKLETDPENAILFIGSSSIRFWNNIKKDMSPYPVIQRGYGGAKFTDIIAYTDRLVYPHKFKAVAVFVANDITGSKDDKTPREVLGLFKGVEKIIRKKNKKQPIYFIAITPNKSRWEVWNKQREANSLIKSYCNSKKNLEFIETEAAFLGSDGLPIDEYFISDKLHLTQKGYDVWAKTIKDNLNKTLK